jgi:hypothetical protein
MEHELRPKLLTESITANLPFQPLSSGSKNFFSADCCICKTPHSRPID